MKRNFRENKRTRTDALSSGSGEELERPLHKKSKQPSSSPPIDLSSYPSTYSDDDRQDSRYTADLVSIRHVVEGLRSSEREFYLAQQKRLERIQSLEREFHKSQQNQYDGLVRMIGDIGQRWAEERNNRHMREVRRLRQVVKKTGSGIDMDKDSTAGEEQASTPPTTQALLSPPQTTNRKRSALLPKIRDTYESESGTEPSQEEEDNSPRQLTAGEKGKQPTINSGLVHEMEGNGQMLKLASPFKTTARDLQYTRQTAMSPPVRPVDPSNDSGNSRVFLHDGGSQPAGFLNEDGAIEVTEIDPSFPGVELEQQHSPSDTLSFDPDRARSTSVGRTNEAPHTSSTPPNDSPQPRRSRRGVPRKNYEEPLPPILPLKQRSKKKAGAHESEESYDPEKESRKKNTGKSSGIKTEAGQERISKYFKSEPARPNPIIPAGQKTEDDVRQATTISSGEDESGPVQVERDLPPSSATLQDQLGTQSKSQSTVALSSTPWGKTSNPSGERPDSARDRYRVVRTSPTS